MNRIIELGAPSLTGKDANTLVGEVFADAVYPLKVVVQNHMPRDVAFPEVDLFLRHAANPKESVETVEIASHDLFQRLASSIEQVAELNRYKLAITISDVVVAPADTGSAAPAAPTDAVRTDVAKNPSEGLTYDQLKDALKAAGIEFTANAKKADLAALLDSAPADTGSAAPAAPTDASV